MQSQGSDIQSFEAVSMNFGYLGQYITSMKKYYRYILIPLSGQASGSKSCWNMQSQGLGIQSYQAVNMNF